MKTDRYWLKTLLVAVVLVCFGCGDGGGGPTAPTAPISPATPVIPMVAGTYTGPITGWLQGQLVGTFPTTLLVVQTGARVTLSGTAEGGVIRITTTSGTVAADGTFMADPGPLPDSETCGPRTSLESEVVFGDGTLRWRDSWDSEGCGVSRFEGDLVRTAS